MRVWQHKNNQRGYFTTKYKRYGVRIDFSKVKHKVPQDYSPADESAGLAYVLRDDDAWMFGV